MIATVHLHTFHRELIVPVFDYDFLDAQLAKIKFFKFVIDENITKKGYLLPPGLYMAYSDLTIPEACKAIREVADVTGRDYSVFVAEYDGAQWYNLKEIELG
ncbi:hypothetical protein [Spirosoma flavus]